MIGAALVAVVALWIVAAAGWVRASRRARQAWIAGRLAAIYGVGRAKGMVDALSRGGGA